jgi:hypothetical protein
MLEGYDVDGYTLDCRSIIRGSIPPYPYLLIYNK